MLSWVIGDRVATLNPGAGCITVHTKMSGRLRSRRRQGDGLRLSVWPDVRRCILKLTTSSVRKYLLRRWENTARAGERGRGLGGFTRTESAAEHE